MHSYMEEGSGDGMEGGLWFISLNILIADNIQYTHT